MRGGFRTRIGEGSFLSGVGLSLAYGGFFCLGYRRCVV